MSEIRVGDLVVVVRTCCEKTAQESLGITGKVTLIRSTTMRCEYCLSFMKTNWKAHFETECTFKCAPLSWLRRIPPLSELESTEHKEETPA